MPSFKPSYKFAIVAAAALAVCSSRYSANAAPAPVASAGPPTATVAPASNNPNYPLWTPNTPQSPTVPQPIRDQLGANILGPQNIPIALQNTDLLAPPTTDHGTMYVHSAPIVDKADMILSIQ